MAQYAQAAAALYGMLSGNPAQDAAIRAQNAQTRLLRSYGQQYNMYGPQLNAMMFDQIKNPFNNPMYRMGMNSAVADSDAYFRGAGRDMLMNLSRRGGGKPGDSSVATNMLLALAKNKGSSLAQGRFGMATNALNNRTGMMQNMTGNLMGMGNTAIAGYGQSANAWQNQANQYGPALQNLIASIGAFGGNSTGNNYKWGNVDTTGIPNANAGNVTTTMDKPWMPSWMKDL
jgi:hypothetical protein